ncbi:carboxypeptidase regulatory-like domain-containing protein [Planctomicrobium sp. SH661]|uniref:carboxypeptidase regulatory-like domain-containing protein n=1 Tax=Planctomicrobium sp. SH661 TaxID=3448124 RepID=UPI003F5AE4B4
MDGKILAGVMVTFLPQQEGRMSSGVTDENGKYELIYMGETKGAVIGSHKVNINTFRPSATVESFEGRGSRPKFTESIPAKYNSQTELTATVKSGDNMIDFNLSSK